MISLLCWSLNLFPSKQTWHHIVHKLIVSDTTAPQPSTGTFSLSAASSTSVIRPLVLGAEHPCRARGRDRLIEHHWGPSVLAALREVAHRAGQVALHCCPLLSCGTCVRRGLSDAALLLSMLILKALRQ